MLTVACVLKTGGDYEPQHVSELRTGVQQHTQQPHQFVCLTDSKHVRGNTLPLLRGWPGWWSKLELFDGRLTGDVLYADLDTMMVGPLDGIATGHRFTVLENFWSTSRIGSGLMAWNADLTEIHRKFSADSDKFIRQYVTTERWGDQGFIRYHSPVPMDRWQRLHAGKVVSFKRHVRPANGVPPGAAVVCFHGSPRPWEMLRHERRWLEHASQVQQAVQVASS